MDVKTSKLESNLMFANNCEEKNHVYITLYFSIWHKRVMSVYIPKVKIEHLAYLAGKAYYRPNTSFDIM